MAYLATTMQRGMGTALLALALGATGCGDDDGELVDARPMTDAPIGVDAALPVDAAPTDDAVPPAEDAAAPAVDAALPPADAALPVDPCTDDCPDTAGVTPPAADLIIESVRIGTPSQVVLRNVAADTTTLTNWYLARRPSYYALPNGFSLAQDAAVTIHLGVGGSNNASNIYIPGVDPLGDAGELALYDSASFFDQDAVQSFVRWGDAPADPEDTSHIGEATSAGRWSAQDDFVAICDGHAGVIATGDTTTPGGYTSVVDACL